MGRWGTTIAQWIHLRLPTCRPQFKYQAHHLCFYHLQSNLCFICLVGGRTELTKKRPSLSNFLKKRYGQGATLVYQCPQKDLSFNFCHPLPFCYFLNQLLLSLQQFGNLLQSLQLTCYAKTITNSSNFCSVYSDFFTNKGL